MTYQFAFVVGLIILSKLRNGDIGIVVADGGIGLEEDKRERRRITTNLSNCKQWVNGQSTTPGIV